jgi:hypothetical protein
MKKRKPKITIILIALTPWSIWFIDKILLFFGKKVLDFALPITFPVITTSLLFFLGFITRTKFYKRMILPLFKQWDDLSTDFFGSKIHQEACNANQLIDFLTSKKFDPNLRCQEKKPFLCQDVSCRHKACRFHYKRFLLNDTDKRKMPKVLIKCLPWRMSLTNRVYLQNPAAPKQLEKNKKIYFSGNFLHWSVDGISFHMDKKEWFLLCEAYSLPICYQGPFRLAAKIKHLLGSYRFNINAMGTRDDPMDPTKVFIEGRYCAAYNPSLFYGHKKGYIKKPLCALLQDERPNNSVQLTYTPTPIIQQIHRV